MRTLLLTLLLLVRAGGNEGIRTELRDIQRLAGLSAEKGRVVDERLLFSGETKAAAFAQFLRVPSAPSLTVGQGTPADPAYALAAFTLDLAALRTVAGRLSGGHALVASLPRYSPRPARKRAAPVASKAQNAGAQQGVAGAPATGNEARRGPTSAPRGRDARHPARRASGERRLLPRAGRR